MSLVSLFLSLSFARCGWRCCRSCLLIHKHTCTRTHTTHWLCEIQLNSTACWVTEWVSEWTNECVSGRMSNTATTTSFWWACCCLLYVLFCFCCCFRSLFGARSPSSFAWFSRFDVAVIWYVFICYYFIVRGVWFYFIFHFVSFNSVSFEATTETMASDDRRRWWRIGKNTLTASAAASAVVFAT